MILRTNHTGRMGRKLFDVDMLRSVVVRSSSLRQVLIGLGSYPCHQTYLTIQRQLSGAGISTAHFKFQPKRSLDEAEAVQKIIQSRINARGSLSRTKAEDTWRWILEDSRRSDRCYGRQNNLSREFVESSIKNGCIYCGETQLRMTLDRIDNEKGHTRDNVVPSCIRCNYTRRDIPYEAWLVIAPGMRRAREAGLFGGWTGQVRRQKK